MKNIIGVLDSGVGGLSVLKELKNVMPHKNYIYFADTLNMPYGTKSPDEIYFFTKKILNFFMEKGVKEVVFACNTTSATAYDRLNVEFSNKLNIFPLIQKVAKYACLGLNDNDKIAILATKATVNSNKYEIEIKKYNPNVKIINVDCTGFVEIVENRLYDDKSSIELIKEKLSLIKGSRRAILGCTHYPYLINIFKKIYDIEYFNPANCLAQVVKDSMQNDFGNGEIEFYVSKSPDDFILSGKMFFDVKEAKLCIL